MPPYVAQVPTARTASALGASFSQPRARRLGLPGLEVVAEAGPVPLFLDGLVGDRPLHHEDEGIQLSALGFAEPLHEVFAAEGIVDQRPVNGDLGKPRKGPQHNLLDAGLHRGGERDGISVAAQAAVDPQDVNHRFFCPADIARPPAGSSTDRAPDQSDPNPRRRWPHACGDGYRAPWSKPVNTFLESETTLNCDHDNGVGLLQRRHMTRFVKQGLSEVGYDVARRYGPASRTIRLAHRRASPRPGTRAISD